MLNNEDLIKKLTKDIKDIEYKINHVDLYNFKCTLKKGLIRSGIALDYALPFIISGVIFLNLFHAINCDPFIKNEVTSKASIYATYTSAGVYNERVSFDIDYYEDEYFQHSTAWNLNDEGLYERKVTSYKIDDSIDLNNIESVLAMEKEDIENSFQIIEEKTVIKAKLEAEDEMYKEEIVVITCITESDEYTVFEKESNGDNIFFTALYLLLTALVGLGLKKVVFRNYMVNKLSQIEQKIKIITPEQLEELRNILKLRMQNLSMLTENQNDDRKVYQFKKGR